MESQQPQISVWDNPKLVAEEIKKEKQSVDYSKIIEPDKKIIFFGDNHSNKAIREHLVENAQSLRGAGITHYAIEANDASNEALDQLNSGLNVDLSGIDLGPGGEDYETVAREMASAGIKVIAIDIDQSNKPSKEEREEYLLKNLSEIFQDDPNAKVAVLIGRFHTTRKEVSGFSYLGNRLKSIDFPTTNISFLSQNDKIPFTITNPIDEAGLSNQKFAINLQKYHDEESVPYGKGEVDWVIHLSK